MRVLSAVLALVLLGASVATAQEPSWGLKGGINLATLSSDEEPSPDLNYRVGLVAGGFFTWPVGARFDIQPEGLFSQQGATGDEEGIDAKIKLDYLVVPILMRYKTATSGGALVLFAGPSLGVKLSAKATAESAGQSFTDDIDELIETFDYGIVFGGGFEAGRFTIDGRYTWGFGNVNADPDDTAKVRNRVISILGGVRF
jgi:hypothetical protein